MPRILYNVTIYFYISRYPRSIWHIAQSQHNGLSNASVTPIHWLFLARSGSTPRVNPLSARRGIDPHPHPWCGWMESEHWSDTHCGWRCWHLSCSFSCFQFRIGFLKQLFHESGRWERLKIWHHHPLLMIRSEVSAWPITFLTIVQ